MRDLDGFDRDDALWLFGVSCVWRRAPPPPQGRFNAGQKLAAALVGGLMVIMFVTGVLMLLGECDTRYRFAGTVIVHDWATWMLVALVAGHLYPALIHRNTRHALRGTVVVTWIATGPAVTTRSGLRKQETPASSKPARDPQPSRRAGVSAAAAGRRAGTRRPSRERHTRLISPLPKAERWRRCVLKGRSVMTFVLVAALAFALGLGIGALAWMGSDHGDMAMADTGSSSTSTSSMTGHSSSMGTMAMQLDEKSFIEQMVPHHQSAVEMARLAVTKAQHAEVRSLARDIIDSQDAEVAKMQTWYRKRYGTELSPNDSMQSMDLSALEAASGDDFDRTFLAMMIPHHASAIVMADSVKLGGPRQEVAQLADEITAAQAKEIGRMQQWRETWYPPLG